MALQATLHTTPFQIVKWSELRTELCKMIGCAEENFRAFETVGTEDSHFPGVTQVVDLWQICVDYIVTGGLGGMDVNYFNPMTETPDGLESEDGTVLACVMVQEGFYPEEMAGGPAKAICLAYKELNKQLNTDTIKTYITFANNEFV